MASQEPESQIVPSPPEFEGFVPSSPPVQEPKTLQEAGSPHSVHHGGEEELDRQNADLEQVSNSSRVEETQFQSVELDTQAVEDPNFPAIPQNSQLREEVISTGPLGATNDTFPVISRPPVEDVADPAAGFTFGIAGKPPTFGRPPVPARAKHAMEQPSEGDKPKGSTSRPPNVTVAVHPSSPSRPVLLRQPSPSNDRMDSHIKTGGNIDGKRTRESPQQEDLSIQVIAHDPQTPVSEASNARSAQKSSNKNHTRIKKPFPEVACLPGNRRGHSNKSTTNIQHMEYPLGHVKNRFEATSPSVFANTGQTKAFSLGIYESNKTTRRQHHSSSVLSSPHGDFPRTSCGYADSNAQQQQHFPEQSRRRASAPLHHRESTWNMDEQEISLEAVHPPQSGTNEPYPAPAAQQHNAILQATDAMYCPSDSLADPIAHADAMVQQDSYNNDLQEELSKDSFNVIEQNQQEPTHLAGSQIACLSDSIINRRVFSVPAQAPSQAPSRAPSEAPSEAPSRPQSRRSNCGKPIIRPVPVHDLRPRGILEFIAQRGTHSTKIKKSSDAPINPIGSECSMQLAIIGRERKMSGPTPGFFDDYKKFLANGQEYLEIMQDFERQSQSIESQKSEIQKLQDTSNSSIKQIEALELEKVELTEKLKKFTELSSKYKKHMNDVVKTQKYLKSQANDIQKTAKEAIEARDAKEAILRKLESAIKDARSLRVPAEKFADVSKQKQGLEVANKTLASENRKFEAGIEKLQSENEKLGIDNKKLHIDLGAATKTCELLRADINRTLLELSREKHQVEQLEKAQCELLDSHKELVGFLQMAPKEVANELNRDEGLLSKILDLGKATQAKVDEAALLSSNCKNQEAGPSASLVKFFEDLFSRFETSMQTSNFEATAQQESNNKLLEDFKKTVDQLRLDKELEIKLNNRISELGRINEALTVDKNGREREIQGFAKQLDELKRDLAECRGQLSAKNDELAAALAAPKEDPRLRAQIQDLETANTIVTCQLDGSKQELTKLEEELSSYQESARCKEQQMRDWEHKFNDAQSRIKNLNDEKNKCLANKQQEIEKACQEARQGIAKSAEASKATLKMKLESEVNHLEQKVKDKDAELALAKEELQKARDGGNGPRNDASRLYGELALYKEKFIQQAAQLKRLEEQNPGRETSDRLAGSLQSIRSECIELRNHLESIRSENSQNIQVMMRGQRAIEENLRQIDALKNENEKLKEKNTELQKCVGSLNEASKQQNSLDNGHRDDRRPIGEVKDITFTTPLGMARPNQPMQYPRPSSAIPSSVGSSSIRTNDRVLDDHGVETPEDALRRAAKCIGSHSSGSQIGKATQASLAKVANNFEIPQIPSHEILKEGASLLNSPSADSSSTLKLQRQGSGTRPLKVATRKHSKFGQSSRKTTGPHRLSRTETVMQDIQATQSGNDNPPYTTVTAFQTPSGITPFSEVALNGPTPSPLTDLSSMMDELGSVSNQKQFREAYERARGGKKNEAPITNPDAAGMGGLQTFARRTMDFLEENELIEGNTAPKVQAPRNPLSAKEEALRRRTAQPPKPAIKKRVVANDVVSTLASKPVVNTTQSKTFARADRFQIQERQRGSYNRAVSGSKPQTPMIAHPQQADESSFGTFNGKQQSPQNIPFPKRNRSASLSAQTQQAPKRVRTSKRVSYANVHVVQDSQEDMQSF